MTDYQIPTPHAALRGDRPRAAARGSSTPPSSRKASGFFAKITAAKPGTAPRPGLSASGAGRVPALEGGQRQTIDDDVLAECFQRLESETEPAKVNFRYVVALLLMRASVSSSRKLELSTAWKC